MEVLQLHGVYLIALGTLMARHNKSAALITGGHYDDQLRDLMIARGATVEEAEQQLIRCVPNDAVNAQF